MFNTQNFKTHMEKWSQLTTIPQSNDNHYNFDVYLNRYLFYICVYISMFLIIKI